VTVLLNDHHLWFYQDAKKKEETAKINEETAMYNKSLNANLYGDTAEQKLVFYPRLVDVFKGFRRPGEKE